MFEEKESYEHKFAKELLHQWLQSNKPIKFLSESTGNQQYVSDNYHFTLMEYPITKSFSCLIDECDCAANYNIGKPDFCNYRDQTTKFCPCIKCKYLKSEIKAIADIAIGRKGSVATIFEVIHKHPLPYWKRDLYQLEGENVYEIDAKHILGQIKVPERLFVRRVC